MPNVSIIVPNYNYARFLDQRLASINKQTYKDFEIILLDDASSDDSVRLLQQFALEHCCRFERNEHNSGNVFKQWNKGIGLAKGRYVWIAEADDYADERFLEILVDRLEQSPGCGLAYCNSLRVDDAGNIVEMVRPTLYDVDLTRWQRDFVGNGREECVRYLLRENTIPNASAVVFKRELCNRVGGADETLALSSDWKLWASLLRLSDIAFVAEPLNFFRVHAGTTRARARPWFGLPEALQVMKYIVDTVDVPQDALEDLHARLAIIILYAFAQQRPTATEFARVKSLAAALQFKFSNRAASSFIRSMLQSIGCRLRGVPQQRTRL
jgi:glycosyltransferase involved in cell wall biosynthesis